MQITGNKIRRGGARRRRRGLVGNVSDKLLAIHLFKLCFLNLLATAKSLFLSNYLIYGLIIITFIAANSVLTQVMLQCKQQLGQCVS